MHSAYSGQLPGRQVFLDQEMGGALVLLKQNQDLAKRGDARSHILHQHIIGEALVLLKQNQDLANGGDTRFHILDQHIIGEAVVP